MEKRIVTLNEELDANTSHNTDKYLKFASHVLNDSGSMRVQSWDSVGKTKACVGNFTYGDRTYSYFYSMYSNIINYAPIGSHNAATCYMHIEKVSETSLSGIYVELWEIQAFDCDGKVFK